MIVMIWTRGVLASGGWEQGCGQPLQYTGQFPSPKNYPVQNENSAKVETLLLSILQKLVGRHTTYRKLSRPPRGGQFSPPLLSLSMVHTSYALTT